MGNIHGLEEGLHGIDVNRRGNDCKCGDKAEIRIEEIDAYRDEESAERSQRANDDEDCDTDNWVWDRSGYS